MILVSLALATSGFDAANPAASFSGRETWTDDEAIQLWAVIERLEDPDRILFAQESFNINTSWPAASAYAPWIDDCFGSDEPPSWMALLHVGLSEIAAQGTPILFVPGAGDNGSRGFITMATHMDLEGRPVYSLTFAHPHGDAFMQAEMIADAIARIKVRTGASKVDVVAHSKGGIAAAIYLSNVSGTTWSDDDYNRFGTDYRDDVRRAVFIATPLDGIDTSFRWPLANLSALESDTALSPSSWRTWYPYTTLNPLVTTDLTAQDFLSDNGDLFPGHRQLLRRQDYDLPGEIVALGLYALQPDWYTTYEGGYGAQSYSDGVDAAIADGDDLIGQIGAAGVDPGVEIFVLAGENPVMPNGTETWLTNYFDAAFLDMATAGLDAWTDLMADLIGDAYVSVGVSESDLQGISSGKLIVGEVTGPSDGLVFVSSATHTDNLTARGAAVGEVKIVNLSHLDLLYASPITGQLLIDDAATDPVEKGWQVGVGERYIVADTINWVEAVLADPPDDSGTTPTDDTGVTPTDDTGVPATDDSDPPANEDSPRLDDTGDKGGVFEDGRGKDGGCGCESTPLAAGGWALFLGMLGLRRRRG